MTVSEAERAAEIVGERVSRRARLIWGCSIEPELEGQIRILLIVTGAKAKLMMGRASAPVASVSTPGNGNMDQQYPRDMSQNRGSGGSEIDFIN